MRTRLLSQGGGVSVALCFAVVTSPIALAHGPAPSVLDAVSVDATGAPTLLRSSIGLLRQTSTGWRYGCPSSWDHDGDGEYDIETPLTVVTSTNVLVAGAPDLFRSDDAACSFMPLPGPTQGLGPQMSALVAGDGGAYALHTGATQSTLYFIGDTSVDGAGQTTTLFSSSLALHSALPRSEGGVLLGGLDATTDPPQAVLLTVDANGMVTQTQHLLPPAAGSPPQRIRLRRQDTQGRVWLSVSTSAGIDLWRIQDDGTQTLSAVLLHQGAVALHGPVALCDGVVWAAGGNVFQDPLLPLTCDASALDTLDVRCLVEKDGQAFACSTFDLVALDAQDGVVSVTPSFRFDELSGPDLTCQSAQEANRCQASWVHFAGEADLLDDTPVNVPPDDAGPTNQPAPKGCCCVIGAVPASPIKGALAGLVFLRLVGLAFVISRRRVAPKRWSRSRCQRQM